MQYSFATRRKKRTPRAAAAAPPARQLPARRDGRRRSPRRTSSSTSALQVQTDPFLMPIENNAVLWPTKLSPRVPAAVLRIPRQTFDSPEQLDFARVLTYNPWHCDRRAPAARQPEPRAASGCTRAGAAAPADERRRALRADGRRGVPRLAADPGQVAQRREAGQEEVRAALDRDEARDVRHALAHAVGRDRERPAVRRRRRDERDRRRRRARRTSGCSARCG